MSTDPASLDNLRDIIKPPPVSWWPLAVGWWLLLGLVLVVLLVVAYRQWREWRANAYRRAALAELAAAVDARTVNELLKRTALTVWPRHQVASLFGAEWCDWLAKSADAPLPSEVAAWLAAGQFCGEEVADLDALKQFAADWIRRHKPLAAIDGRKTRKTSKTDQPQPRPVHD